jgi:hypothetical protein
MTTTNLNPITQTEHRPRWPWNTFGRRVSVDPGQALVIRYRDSRLAVLGDDQVPPTLPELAWARIATVFRVDVSEHTLTWDMNAPCVGDLGSFQVRVDLRCRVSQPIVIVDRNIRDVLAILAPPMTRVVRSEAARYRFYERHHAESILGDRLNSPAFLQTLDPAFTVKEVGVWLTLDPEARYHVARRLYRALIDDGVESLFAERLAQNPGDIESVTALLQQAHQQRWDNSHKVLMDLHGADVIEDQHLKPVVEQLIGILGSRAITGDDPGRKGTAPDSLPEGDR